MNASRLSAMQRVLDAEATALRSLHDHLSEQEAALSAACDLIIQRCGEGGGDHSAQSRQRRGRLVCTGVGKAGLVGRKISATFASTGTPGFFLHPAEALHGDLGMVAAEDVVLALSNSGSSDELLALLPALAHLGAPLIAICGNPQSALAQHAHCVLSLGHLVEACPLGLAPSTTTTAMLALGDALALTVQAERGFTAEQYARFHPGGALGRQLMTCAEAMRSGHRLALVHPHTTLIEAMRAIGAARAGSAVVIDEQQQLRGILTDGDIRRALSGSEHASAQILGDAVQAHATMPCKAIRAKDLLSAALGQCATHRINELPVIDEHQRVLGLIDIQDLVSRGFDIAPR